MYRKKKSRKKIKISPLNLLIIMGGSDPANLTVRALKDIRNIEKTLNVAIVTGPGYRYHAELQKYVDISKHTVSLNANLNVGELLNLMNHADIGVVHYGITAYEMACIGLPFVAIAHNREEFIENRLVEYGFCIDAGLCDTLKPGDILSCINELLNNKSFRVQLSENGMDSVDAKGLTRIADLMIDVLEKENPKKNMA